MQNAFHGSLARCGGDPEHDRCLTALRVQYVMGSEAYCVLDLNFLKVRKRPGSIEVAIGRLVESEIRKPVFARDGWNPVVLEAGRRLRSAIDVHRAILVFAQVDARGAIGNLLFVQGQSACSNVVDGD